MKTQILLPVLLAFFITVGCSKDKASDEDMQSENTDDPTETENETETEVESLYFPPIDSETWETTTPTSLEWNLEAEQPLYDFLEKNNSEAFIILKDGKIVVEKYFGDFDATKNHTWNSAAKTLTSMVVGIAQHENFLSIDDSTSDYLGEGWTMLTPEQEEKITIKHHLTMATGLDYTVDNTFCNDVECLIYKNEPNTFWYYHNATYALLDEIVGEAVGKDFQLYFNEKIKNPIGMQGAWIKTGYLNLYHSTARSMARYGLLNLNNGVWDTTTIIEDQDYFKEATNTSQDLNESYGYLYWLNGKNSHKITASEELFDGKLIPNAPDDLYAGLGAFDQKLYVIPSKNMIIVRMGDAANGVSLGSSGFDNMLWEKINDFIE